MITELLKNGVAKGILKESKKKTYIECQITPMGDGRYELLIANSNFLNVSHGSMVFIKHKNKARRITGDTEQDYIEDIVSLMHESIFDIFKKMLKQKKDGSDEVMKFLNK